MSVGPHFHHFHKLLKAKVFIHTGGELSGRETVVMYRECDCGCINKIEALVTHEDGQLVNPV